MLGGTTRLAGRHDSAARAGEVDRATAGTRWSWRWQGWTAWRLDRLTLVSAAVVVGLDVASAWVGVSIGTLGRIPVTPALPFAVAMAARMGAASFGWTGPGVRAWREFGIGVLVVMTAWVSAYGVEVGGPGEALGLVVAAAGEELVYRLAVLVLIGAAAARLGGRDWRCSERWGTGAGSVALVGGAIVFSALPGHVTQVHDVASAVPFASLAIVLGWVVLRTGAIGPAIAAHALLNLATITALSIGAPGSLRLGVAAATLVALVVGADLAGRRTGRLRRVPNGIDLTAV